MLLDQISQSHIALNPILVNQLIICTIITVLIATRA